jgi:DNA-binding transcriptional regulator GbsR (MarR family)
MSVEEFVKQIQEEHKEELSDVEKLLKALEKIEERETEIYQFFITSNL